MQSRECKIKTSTAALGMGGAAHSRFRPLLSGSAPVVLDGLQSHPRVLIVEHGLSHAIASPMAPITVECPPCVLVQL